MVVLDEFDVFVSVVVLLIVLELLGIATDFVVLVLEFIWLQVGYYVIQGLFTVLDSIHINVFIL